MWSPTLAVEMNIWGLTSSFDVSVCLLELFIRDSYGEISAADGFLSIMLNELALNLCTRECVCV